MIHELKTWSKYFQEVKSGRKTFEVRKNDRDFREGDTLILKEWQPKGNSLVSPNKLVGEYTGDELEVEITYMMQAKPENAALFGLSSNTSVMAIKPIKELQVNPSTDLNQD